MARRTVLTSRQRSALFALPQREADLLRHYTLSDEDLQNIGARRRPHNKLGFAVQLCVLRHPGRLLAPGEFVPPAVVDFIGRQLDVDGDDLADYAVRSATRHDHLAELRRLYGFRSFSGGAARELVERLREEAEQAQSNEDLVRRFVEACRGTRTILRATTTIERLCADALVDAERRIEARIAERVPPGLRRDLEHLLEETAAAGVTRFVWLRQFEPGSNSADANRLLDRLEHLQRLDVPEGLFTESLRIGSRGCAGRGSATSPTGSASFRTTATSRFSRSAPSSGRCSSPTRWWRPTTGSSAERIATPPGPVKRSSGTRRPRSARRSGHSPSWGRRCSARGTPARPSTR